MSIQELNEAVFNYLFECRKKDKDLYFTLRGITDNHLENGHWFDGVSTVRFTFWNGIDFRENDHRIFFTIKTSGELQIRLSATDNVYYANIFSQIVELIGGFTRTFNQTGFINKWRKTLTENDWKKNLDVLISEILPKINTVLNLVNNLGLSREDFPPAAVLRRVSETDFVKYLYVLQKRERYHALMTNSEKKVNAKTVNTLLIQSVKLVNIGHFNELLIDDFKRVNVFIGFNGSGKSTVIRALALGFTGLHFFNGNSKDTWFIDKDFLRNMMRIKSYEEQPIFCEESHIEIGIELNGEKKVNKIELSKKDGGKYPTVDEEIHSVIETKRGQEARTELAVLTVGLPQTHKEGNQVRIAEPVKYPSPFSLLNLIGSKRIEFGNIIKWIDANYFKVINGAAQSNEKDRTTYLGVINHLFRLISKVVSDNEDDNSVRLLKTDRDENGEIRAIVITPDAPSGINMTLLSDGFQNLFYWFANILTAFYGFRFFYENNEGYEDFKENIREIKDIPALIFIDEIDTYLHPTWQAKILNVLVEEFPKAQFFVTTHSPLVLWSLDKDKIDFNYYSISENGSEKMTYNPYSALVNDLLESVFKQPKRSQEISAMQNELFRSISFLNRDNYDAEIASVEQKLKTFQSKLYPGDLDALTAEMTLRSKKFNIQKLKNANNQ